MADPLGMISGSMQGPGGVGGAGGIRPGQVAAGQNQPGANSFSDVLKNGLDKLNSAQQDADAAIEDIATGKGNVEDVLLATQKADMAFKMALALRNKVQSAYEELKQVRI